MATVKSSSWIQVLVAVLAVSGLALLAAEPPEEELHRKPSTYAPAKDLESQVQFFLDRIKDELKDESKYDAESVKRVVRDANTLAVLALVLGKHDEANRFQSASGALLEQALKLAHAAPQYQEAQAAYAKLAEATSAGDGSASLTWKSVGNIAEIMNQVPLLHTKLSGQVTSADRFRKSRDQAAGLAATLAAIAQVSVFDNSYCSDPGDQASWIELCALMRDAAYDINQAIHSGDRDAAVAALKPIKRTCDDCHEQFKN